MLCVRKVFLEMGKGKRTRLHAFWGGVPLGGDLCVPGPDVVEDLGVGAALSEDVVDEFVTAASLALRHVEPAGDDAELFNGMLQAG